MKKKISFLEKSKKNKKLKYKSLNTKNWGINYNKNEYQEIVLSNSNHPECRSMS